MKEWLKKSKIPVIKKIGYEIKVAEEQKKLKKKIEQMMKYLYIKDKVIRYYENISGLRVTPELQAKIDMEERIKTVEELEFWYRRAIKYEIEQLLTA